MKVLALLVAGFLFLSTIEAFGGFWLAGRWYVSSRYASVSLQTVKNWLDRGTVNRTTEWAKVFINRHGKWIILLVGLSQVIGEVERLQRSVSYCYVAERENSDMVRCFVDSRGFRCIHDQQLGQFLNASYDEHACLGLARDIPGHMAYVWEPANNRWRLLGNVPSSGSHYLGRRSSSHPQCYVNVSLTLQTCPFPRMQTTTVNGYPPSGVNWQERRRVPVRVFPNVNDFVRPDVIEADPSLRWLRDEYQRIASDSSIPLIPSDALGDLDLPSVDWSISPDEAIDFPAERGSTREGSREGDIDISIPGLDTSLNVPERRAFPVELINQLVQNHPLLRILQSVSLDATGGGSCVFGSAPFVIDVCRWQWVFNLMGSFLVPLAFLYGLFGWRSD